MATQITKNFTLEEFLRSSTADKYNIDNSPTDEVLQNIYLVASQLQVVRNVYGKPILISSGYRCPLLNSRVRGVSNSAHIKGLAVDINNGRKNNEVLFNLLMELRPYLAIDELINENNYSWIHVSFKFNYK